MIDIILFIVAMILVGYVFSNVPTDINIQQSNYQVPAQPQQVPPSRSQYSSTRVTASTNQNNASTQPRTPHNYESRPIISRWRQAEDPTLTATVFRNADTQNWATKSMSELRLGGYQSRYFLASLQVRSMEYQKVYWLFKNTAQRQLKIHKILRVENPYLLGSYILKREELVSKFRLETKEVHYFHGTKAKNVMSICSNNFNWRLHGDSLGNSRYGKGVSFSPIANYSSHYGDNIPNCENVMFLARVLVTGCLLGSKHMIIPPDGYDTAKKEDGKVVVKFCDNEFYPEYVIYYTGSAIRNII